METLLLGVHIAGGFAGLVMGPVAMLAPKRRGRHTSVGIAYQVATAVMCSTAIGLAVLEPRVWWLGLIAVATWAAALAGWEVRRRRARGWLPLHVQLMSGSYVSFVTAFLVVNWDSAVAWIAPTIVATPLIARATARAATTPRRDSAAAR